MNGGIETDFLREYIDNKIFVTGITGGGKSFISGKLIEKDSTRILLGINMIKADNTEPDFYNNCNNIEYLSEYYKHFPERFVMDGIPYFSKDGHMDLSSFRNYTFFNKVKVICVVPGSLFQWEQRMVSKSIPIAADGSYLDFAMFYYKVLPMIAYLDIDYIDTCSNEYITLDELYHRITWTKILLNYL